MIPWSDCQPWRPEPDDQPGRRPQSPRGSYTTPGDTIGANWEAVTAGAEVDERTTNAAGVCRSFRRQVLSFKHHAEAGSRQLSSGARRHRHNLRVSFPVLQQRRREAAPNAPSREPAPANGWRADRRQARRHELLTGDGLSTASATTSGIPDLPRAVANERRKSCHVHPFNPVASLKAALMSLNVSSAPPETGAGKTRPCGRNP